MRKIGIFLAAVLLVTILICYSIEIKDKRLLDMKTTEHYIVQQNFEQMKYFNHNVALYIDGEIPLEAVDVGSTYLLNSYSQFVAQIFSQGLQESQDFKEIDYIWRYSYFNITINEDSTEEDLKKLQKIEAQFLEIENRINNEIEMLTEKIRNYWWAGNRYRSFS
ncbi:hypothetical protein [Bacillus solimangrovi]|uniref:Uncharacterized protein n=1 Tax=Bacillus solimangrovi TaxID=1305675 RepID=A0A1E5LEM0_9BACI|nr:hypothetical protein [Bacillus solimangrovi]OEH92533.1 hypothetical protein BFG57_15470 [Bacillus solimangrovi]